jgi:hypothetical protein
MRKATCQKLSIANYDNTVIVDLDILFIYLFNVLKLIFFSLPGRKMAIFKLTFFRVLSFPLWSGRILW